MSNQFSAIARVAKTPKVCVPTPILPPLPDPYCPNSLFCELNYHDEVYDTPLEFHSYLHLDFSTPCSHWEWSATADVGWETMHFFLEMVNTAWPEITTVRFDAIATATGTHVGHTWSTRPPDETHPWLWQSPQERTYIGGKPIDFAVLIGDIGDPHRF